MGIDPQLYESATIDGANKWQCTFKITLPMLASVIVILMILSIGHIFYADFGLFYQLPLQSGMLFSTTDVINYFTYRALIEVQDYGMAAAVGFFQSIMGFIMILVANWTARRISQGEHGLF
jgi:putative aldouronate transport system permease protein